MMPRESRISATRPVFPSFLLPSVGFGSLRRRRDVDDPPTAGEPAYGTRTATAAGRLRRVSPDTLRCMRCSTDVALASHIVSKGFTGRHGRAFLVTPPAPPAEQTLANIRVGRSEDRQLVTGWHVVADIFCATCSRKLGWKYVDAKESSQRYKVGKYILEVERVVTHRCWEDEDGPAPSMSPTAAAEGDIVFDSDDDDECEDLFNGVWTASGAAKRRRQSVVRRLSSMAV
ncbi:hypothetical protein L249_0972 [Ophiocordyceps polyrhachis-furcata BCC 54312]|uniref:Yippee domain-containing protein n=1 Tax=Ophiocordyceps polyrhachis-furcata BCC 54312 TaxID=1330021 RepID=A0A367LEJ0_9HYPO|nr:hypothetical protein L249_0972 [Ophiocordyceps polyrhachis-furcata BCC 54312]